MTVFPKSGFKIHLKPAEELVPTTDWFEFLNKATAKVFQEAGVVLRGHGYKYHDFDFWRELVFMTLNHLSVESAGDDLDDLLYAQAHHGRGRKPAKKRLGGSIKRFTRLAPNESQVDDFLRELGDELRETLADRILKATVDLAWEEGLIGDEVEVLVDYHNKYFYGKDVFPANPFITGVHKGPGTNKARKFCALMLSSGRTWLFFGVFLTQQGKEKAPGVAAAIEKLRQWGYKIKRVMGDREFSNYDLVARLTQLDLHYTGSIKKSPRVKEVVDAFLAGECRAVVSFALQQGPKTYYKLGDVPVHLILKVHKGERARDVRKTLAAGTITLKEARKKVHVFVTSEQPPREKGKLVPWGLALIAGFRRRWRIETGFRDLNRLFPTSHARSNGAKMLVLALQMFAFNAWQIQRARTHKLRRVPKAWRAGPTLQRFGKVVTAFCAC